MNQLQHELTELKFKEFWLCVIELFFLTLKNVITINKISAF